MSRQKRQIAIILMVCFFSVQAHAFDIVNGKKVYLEHCSRCHGETGQNLMVIAMPDFSYGDRMFKSDRLLLRSIEQGIGVMPGYKGVVADKGLLDVIAYIRTLF